MSKSNENLNKKQVIKAFFAINDEKSEELKTFFLENNKPTT
jgi:hypothetical protein